MFQSYITSASTTYRVKVLDEFHIVPLALFKQAMGAGRIPENAVVDMALWELPPTRDWRKFRLVDKFVPQSEI
eukprot:3766276-Amphidinium_carterae.1